MGEPSIEIRVVSKGELRAMHNEAELWERALLGRDGWYFDIEESGHPSAPRAKEPYCTHSQILAYRDDAGRQRARVHRYVRPDGSIGASGKPDPKEILGDDGILYVVFEPPASSSNYVS